MPKPSTVLFIGVLVALFVIVGTISLSIDDIRETLDSLYAYKNFTVTVEMNLSNLSTQFVRNHTDVNFTQMILRDDGQFMPGIVFQDPLNSAVVWEIRETNDGNMNISSQDDPAYVVNIPQGLDVNRKQARYSLFGSPPTFVTPNAQYDIIVASLNTTATNSKRAGLFVVQHKASASSSTGQFGINAFVYKSGSGAMTNTAGGAVGGQYGFRAASGSSGAVASAGGLTAFAALLTGTTATIAKGHGFRSTGALVQGGSQNYTAFLADDGGAVSGGGTLPNQWAFYSNALTSATRNYGIGLADGLGIHFRTGVWGSWNVTNGILSRRNNAINIEALSIITNGTLTPTDAKQSIGIITNPYGRLYNYDFTMYHEFGVTTDRTDLFSATVASCAAGNGSQVFSDENVIYGALKLKPCPATKNAVTKLQNKQPLSFYNNITVIYRANFSQKARSGFALGVSPVSTGNTSNGAFIKYYNYGTGTEFLYGALGNATTKIYTAGKQGVRLAFEDYKIMFVTSSGVTRVYYYVNSTLIGNLTAPSNLYRETNPGSNRLGYYIEAQTLNVAHPNTSMYIDRIQSFMIGGAP